MYCFLYYICCRRGNKDFDVDFVRIKCVLILSKDKDNAGYEEGNG